jgi:RNA polymerase sigma-70 factor (ECF subfamily)
MLDSDAERKLINAISTGDQHGIERFDSQYRRYLENLARASGVPAEDCEDVAQEALIAAIRTIERGRFRGECSLQTFLVAILRKKITDHRRKQRRAPDLRLDGGTDLIEVEAWDAGPPTWAADIRLMTEQALQSMPDEHRLILLLNQAGGWKIREIAAMIGRPGGGVGRMLSEAKKMFRQRLS